MSTSTELPQVVSLSQAVQILHAAGVKVSRRTVYRHLVDLQAIKPFGHWQVPVSALQALLRPAQ